jgi:enamine deaminase RidA (YjgF/YER057c/UK114 family)
MVVELRDSLVLAPPPGYSHVAIARGAKLVFTAGAVPLDSEGSLVGEGDAVVQATQVISNLIAALETAGAQPGTVVKTTVYVAGGNHGVQSAVWEVVRSSSIGRVPSTLVGVASLGYPGQLVEIEAVAVLD